MMKASPAVPTEHKSPVIEFLPALKIYKPGFGLESDKKCLALGRIINESALSQRGHLTIPVY